MYFDPAVLSQSLDKIAAFNPQQKEVILSKLDVLFCTIYFKLTQKIVRENVSQWSERKLTFAQANMLCELLKSCLEYLSFHNDPKRAILYKMLSSHGKSGQKRALESIETIVKFIFSLYVVPQEKIDENINQFRKDLIRSVQGKYIGRHSLSTYLEKTTLISLSSETSISFQNKKN